MVGTKLVTQIRIFTFVDSFYRETKEAPLPGLLFSTTNILTEPKPIRKLKIGAVGLTVSILAGSLSRVTLQNQFITLFKIIKTLLHKYRYSQTLSTLTSSTILNPE